MALDRVDEQFERADTLFVGRQFREAASMYRAVLETTPESIDATIGLASALSLNGDPAATLSLWESVFNRGGVHGRTPTLLNFLTALDDLERPPAGRPVTAPRLLARTYAYRYLAILDRRMLDRVVSAADQALALDPTLAGAFISKGVVYAKWDDPALALDQFARAAALQPTADTYRRIAEAAGTMGRLREEINAYRRTVQLEPDNWYYAGRLGDVMLNKYGDFYQAVEYYGRAHRLAPDNRSVGVMYGYALDQLRRPEDAETVHRDLLRRWPRDPEVVTFAAQHFIDLRRYQEAIDILVSTGPIEALSFDAAEKLGFAYQHTTHLEKAITAYEAALRIRPDDVDLLYDLQALYRRTGRHQEGYDAVLRILKIDPNHSGAQRLLPYVERNRPR